MDATRADSSPSSSVRELPPAALEAAPCGVDIAAERPQGGVSNSSPSAPKRLRSEASSSSLADAPAMVPEKRRRLVGKQAPPDHLAEIPKQLARVLAEVPPLREGVAGAPTARVAKAAATRSQPKAKAPARNQSSIIRSTIGHDLGPLEMGRTVKVRGDGWGAGTGEYEAIVTEADVLTFTVIRQQGVKNWEETHVLKEHCELVAEQPGINLGKRRRT